jgi:hypothetical protein
MTRRLSTTIVATSILTIISFAGSLRADQSQETKSGGTSTEPEPSIEKNALPNGQTEIRIVGTEDEVDDIITYLSIVEGDGLEPPGELKEPQSPAEMSDVLMGGFPDFKKARRWITKHDPGWLRMKPFCAVYRDPQCLVWSDNHTCARYRDNSSKDKSLPPWPWKCTTAHSRVGRDSVKLNYSAKVGSGNVCRVRSGDCAADCSKNPPTCD